MFIHHRTLQNHQAPAHSQSPTNSAKHQRLVRKPFSLPRWQRLSIYASTALLTATGLAWLAFHFLAPDAQDTLTSTQLFPWQSSKQWSMRLHAAAAIASWVAIGSLIPIHMAGAWRRRVNRASAVAMLCVFVLLTLTGYALWYASEGGMRQGSAWLHWVLGCGVPVGLWLHIWLGRSTRYS